MRVIASRLVLSVVILLLGATFTASAQPTIVASSWPALGGEGSLAIGGDDNRQVAQVFTASMGRLIGQVRLPVWCSTDATLSMEIQRANTRGPTGIVLSTWTVPGATLPPLAGTELRILRLPEPIPVGETQQYAIVLRSSGTCSVLRGPAGVGPDFESNLYVAAPPNAEQWTCLTCDAPFEERFDIPFIVVGEDRSLPRGFQSLIEVGPKSWHAVASQGQVVGAAPTFGGQAFNTLFASMWFNEFGDVATLRFGERGGSRVSLISLRCAAAGSVGPSVWSAANVNLSGVTIELLTRDLVAVPRSADCPVAITNVASLQAAADARLLYLEIERPSLPTTIRGQLLPRPIGSPGIRATAGASAQQVVGTEHAAPQWVRASVSLLFSEQASLDAVAYAYDERHRYRSVALYCGPPGQNGDLVAWLPAPKSVISKEDLYPVAATGPCGIALDTTGALLEALLRGNLYVSMELIEPAGLVLRGQFSAP